MKKLGLITGAALAGVLSVTQFASAVDKGEVKVETKAETSTALKAEVVVKDGKTFLKVTANEDVRKGKVVVTSEAKDKQTFEIDKLDAKGVAEFELVDIEKKDSTKVLPKTSAWVEDKYEAKGLKGQHTKFDVEITFEKVSAKQVGLDATSTETAAEAKAKEDAHADAWEKAATEANKVAETKTEGDVYSPKGYTGEAKTEATTEAKVEKTETVAKTEPAPAAEAKAEEDAHADEWEKAAKEAGQ